MNKIKHCRYFEVMREQEKILIIDNLLNKSITIEFEKNGAGLVGQGMDYLIGHGFNVVGFSLDYENETNPRYIVFTDYCLGKKITNV
jgi:O-acetylhomoserine/O-acetylserine sulfhydrylase-like pyridoxal-dependent enzyme